MSNIESNAIDNSLERAKHCDALCDEFESQWVAGNRPTIEAFLLQVEESEKQSLLMELVAIEMHYRKRLGESAAISEYQSRFPGLSVSQLDDTHQRTMQLDRPLASERARDLLNRPDLGSRRQSPSFTSNEQLGTMIAGRYKLLEAIGEGGMGTVWVAEQIEPVRRKVALKLIKAGMDSKSVIARFEAERQALAVMDHPNIAKVLDGGLTESGRPFFVMEYVKGVPITEYCDAKRLSVADRLHLFAQVCQAVQHAHQKGIIHRDLKPSNILVAPYDDLAVPKVIDFGLAKAMHQPLIDRTLHTAHDVVLGTPLYMSPEQAQLNNVDVDTRSDIYSLGVVLYELLTGTTPLEKQRFKEAAWNEMRRVICEEEPPRPSLRISSAQTLPSLAAGRQIEPARLTKLVRGELDWIVMKALEKDRARRYETANGFALDVQRYIAGEPVFAAPPSASYLLRKFARKHRRGLVTAAMLTLLLVAGASISTWQAIRATRAETIARNSEQAALNAQRAESERAEGERLAKLDALAKQEEAERQKARAEAETKKADEEKQIANAVLDFLQNKLLRQADVRSQADALLKAGDLASETKENPTIRELLDRAAAELTADNIETNFPNQPLVQAAILQTVGDTYRRVGEYDKAIDLLQLSLALNKQFIGLEQANTLKCMSDLSLAYQVAGKSDLALRLLTESLMLSKKKLGPDHPLTILIMNNFALVNKLAGNLEVALPLFEETFLLSKAKLGLDHPLTLSSMGYLAAAYRDSGKLEQSQSLCELTMLHMKTKLGLDHPDTLTSISNLASLYRDTGKIDLSTSLLEETLTRCRMKLGPDHHDTLKIMSDLAGVYRSAKRLDDSIALYEEAYQHRESKLGREHLDTLFTAAFLGANYKDAGRLEEALPLLEEIFQASKKYSKLNFFTIHLLDVYVLTGRKEQAVALANELVAEARTSFPDESNELADKISSVGLLLNKAKAFSDAERYLRECLAICEQTGSTDWKTFNTQSRLGHSLLGQKKYDEAVPFLLSGYEGLKECEKTIPQSSLNALPRSLDRLIELYKTTDQPDELAKWQTERVKYSNN